MLTALSPFIHSTNINWAPTLCQEHISGEIVNLAGAVTTSSVVPALPQGSLGYTPPLNSEQTLLRCLPDLAAGAGLEPRTSLEARQSQDWEAERQQPQPGLSGT